MGGEENQTMMMLAISMTGLVILLLLRNWFFPPVVQVQQKVVEVPTAASTLPTNTTKTKLQGQEGPTGYDDASDPSYEDYTSQHQADLPRAASWHHGQNVLERSQWEAYQAEHEGRGESMKRLPRQSTPGIHLPHLPRRSTPGIALSDPTAIRRSISQHSRRNLSGAVSFHADQHSGEDLQSFFAESQAWAQRQGSCEMTEMTRKPDDPVDDLPPTPGPGRDRHPSAISRQTTGISCFSDPVSLASNIARNTSSASNIEGEMGADPVDEGDKRGRSRSDPTNHLDSPGELERNKSASSSISMELGDFERAWMNMLGPGQKAPVGKGPGQRGSSYSWKEQLKIDSMKLYMTHKQNSREQIVDTPPTGSG